MSELGDCFKRVNASKIFSLPFSARNHHEEFRTKNYSKMYFYHARFIHCKWELKDFRKIIEKGSESLRTHLRRKNVWNVLCKEAQMIGEVLVPYTFRHLYAKASHAAGIPITNIALLWVTPQKCIIKVMQDSFQTVRLICMPNKIRRSPKYGKETQLAQILCSSSSDSPVPCNYSVFMDCVYRSSSNPCG